MRIEFYCKPGCEPVRYGSGWFDLKTSEDVSFKRGDIVRIDFGVIFNYPKGIEGVLVPRSSTIERHGLILSGIGVIDNEYKGPDDYIGGRFYALCDGFIPRGTRVAQLRFQKAMPTVDLIQCDEAKFSSKNRGGFGSTDNMEISYDEGFINGIEYAIRNKITG